MSPPPTSIDGTHITGATIDGQDVQEITIDGQTVFSAGPDNGLYLDDWADNLLTNRDGYGETQLDQAVVEPDDSATEYRGPVRPEWTTFEGSVSASNQQIQVGQNGAVHTPADIQDPPAVVEFDVLQHPNNTSVYNSILATQTDNRNSDFEFVDSYFVLLTSGLFRDPVNRNSIIDFAVATPPYTFRLENDYDPNNDVNNFEIFIDGSSVGTATDGGKTTEIESVAFNTRNRTTSPAIYDNLRVF